MITQRDIAAVFPPVFATYVAREMGTMHVGKVICFLDQVTFSFGVGILFKK